MNTEGTLRVLHEVTVQRGDENEFVAISAEPAAPGELLRLDRIVNREAVSSRVCVVDSRPVVAGGSVRHRLRLKPVDEDGAGENLQSSATAPSRTR
jgi:hypothetical protein